MKWQQTDAGSIEIEEVLLKETKRIKPSEAELYKYGLNSRWTLAPDGDFILFHRLVAFDKNSRAIIPGLATYTVDEILNKLKISGRSPDSVVVAKQYNISFKFKNIGRTSVNNLRFQLDGPKEVRRNRDAEIVTLDELKAGTSRYAQLYTHTDIGIEQPETMTFSSLLEYTVAGQNVKRTNTWTYSRDYNGFRQE